MNNQTMMTWAEVTMAVCAFLMLVGGFCLWLYKRGGDERTLATSVKEHAVATTALADQVGGLKDTMERHNYKLLDHDYQLRDHGLQLQRHDFRLEALEGQRQAPVTNSGAVQ